jgi:hypothetical protein
LFQEVPCEGLQRDDVFAMRDNDLGERDAILIFHSIADDRERVRADLAAWCDVVGPVEITLVDFGLRHEPFDVDRVRTLDLDSLQFRLVNRYIAPLGEFVAAAFVLRINDPAALFVDHLLPQTMAGLGIDLVEVRLFRLRGGREKLDGAGDERKTQIALPVSTGHGAVAPFAGAKITTARGLKAPSGRLAATVSNVRDRSAE